MDSTQKQYTSSDCYMWQSVQIWPWYDKRFSSYHPETDFKEMQPDKHTDYGRIQKTTHFRGKLWRTTGENLELFRQGVQKLSSKNQTAEEKDEEKKN